MPALAREDSAGRSKQDAEKCSRWSFPARQKICWCQMARKRQIPRAKPGPRNNPRNDKFRCFSANCKVRASTYQRAVKLGPDAAQILGAEARGRTVGYVGAEATTHKLRSFSA